MFERFARTLALDVGELLEDLHADDTAKTFLDAVEEVR
jgi:hypothetical protein